MALHCANALKAQARSKGLALALAEIMPPARLEPLAKLLLLASGKPDDPAIARLYDAG